MLSPEQLENCRKRFASEKSVQSVWLMGSACTEWMRPESDVDFAVRFVPGGKIDTSVLAALITDLEDILQRKVDLGQLNTHNLVYAKEAVQNGRLFFTRNEAEALRFQEQITAQYLDLKIDRKVVEEAYRV